jgi:hypothetical protein
MDPTLEQRRLIIEAIATLVHIKSAMVETLFKPAGVPSGAYQHLLYKRDETTGKVLSKRQMAPLLLAEIEKCPDAAIIVRKLLEQVSEWTSFHLADDEYPARAVVQKARELLGVIEIMEAREAAQREQGRKEELAKMQRERIELLERRLELLLMQFDQLSTADDHHQRGYLLQDLLPRVLDAFEIPVVQSFVRNSGGEQIDGALKLEGWHYLVECRWRERLADIRNLDGLLGQVQRSGKQTMGIFLSIQGWSENVVPLLKQNPEKSIILMEGYDLRSVLSGRIDLREFLLAKVAALNLKSEPFLGAANFLADQSSG